MKRTRSCKQSSKLKRKNASKRSQDSSTRKFYKISKRKMKKRLCYGRKSRERLSTKGYEEDNKVS